MGDFIKIHMTLEAKIQKILDNIDDASSDDIIEIIKQIQPQFRSKLTTEYLQGKIQKISDISDGVEKKKQCTSLLPYFDWYLQGL
jgi:hypothetical protein|tara:strand:+ start:29661 stop:29915 length:255 start_codon:yes stop_codon:yes gene_type:complete